MIQANTNNKLYKQVKTAHKDQESPHEYAAFNNVASNGYKTPS